MLTREEVVEEEVEGVDMIIGVAVGLGDREDRDMISEGAIIEGAITAAMISVETN